MHGNYCENIDFTCIFGRYETAYGDISFDPEKFPSPKEMIDKLHADGFRVTTWVTPFVNKNSNNYEDFPQYFVQTSDNNPGLVTWWDGVGRIIDFTNADACQW